MDIEEKTQRLQIEAALSAHLELLSGGVSGASIYRVHGLTESCVLKVVAAESAAYVRVRGRREIHFYRELAARIPLHTPRVLSSLIDESGFCALLLAAYTPLKSASELNDDAFNDIVKELATFHAMYWRRVDQLNRFSWLKKSKPLDIANDVRHAYETWTTLAQQPQLSQVLPHATLRKIEAAISAIGANPSYESDMGMTLCHGDCHLDNVLSDEEGRLIWADWQEVHIGYGASDLTFLLQRAEANGADIAHDRIIAAYCGALEAAGVEDVNENAIESAMNESERRTRLLYWPDYMHDATPETMTRHLTRIFSL